MEPNILLWVIGRICQDSRIKSAHNPVAAFDNYAMRVGFQKFVVEKYTPLGMHYLTTTVSIKCFTPSFFTCVFGDKVFE